MEPAPAGRVTVRAVRDADDIDALNAGNRAWHGGELVRELFAVDDGNPSAMFLAELDGHPVGYAHAVGHGVADGHRGLVWVNVLPAYRRRGVGAALWRAVLEVCTPERVPGVMTQVDDDDEVGLEVALAHGFVRRGLHHESVLDLTDVDHLAAYAETGAAGVELRSLPDDADEATWRRFKEVYDRLMLDTPDMADGADLMGYELLRTVLKEPWQVMCAWHGDRLVGFTALAVSDRGRRSLNTWMTGVERDFRGRGLSTALKSRQALAVRDAGWREIVTQNMAGNAPILAANQRMGFVRGVGLRDLSYDFAADG